MAQNLISEEMVIEEVKKAVSETLGVDIEEIQPESSLINDLGAESLDFLDINYRLEQTFGIRMARHFILEHIEEMFGEGSAIDDEGRLTDKAVQLLNIRYEGEGPEVEPGMDMDEVPTLITIKSLASGIMDILDTLPEKCPSCGGDWQLDGTRIKCSACGEYGEFTSGDDLIQEWLKKVQEERHIFG
ncbi:MAG: acyl carrier protein [Nitrospirae bacterium]|nr:MAG: acyl carrier protein [Nitrospirota bacterium]